MLYIIFITGKCNLKCDYCGGDVSTNVMPLYINYPIEKVVEFIKKDEDRVVAFYGGEPTLFPNLIEKYMNLIGKARYVMQTNGLLLTKMPKRILKNLDAILVSLDGRREITDMYRGEGVYEKVIENVRKIRNFYSGDLIARMVVTEHSDIYQEVSHLLKLNLFDHIHWQLDVVWSDRWNDFTSWLNNSYLPGLDKLASLWIKNLRKGNIFGIVPFLGILKRILFGGRGLHCGAGKAR